MVAVAWAVALEARREDAVEVVEDVVAVVVAVVVGAEAAVGGVVVVVDPEKLGSRCWGFGGKGFC